MKKISYILFSLASLFLFNCQQKESTNSLVVGGIQEPVEVIRDQWGINHIYANNQQDLFFCAGVLCCKRQIVSV